MSPSPSCRLLSWFALRRQHFDLIDIDSFGSEASFVGGALGAMRYGGLLCLTSTAGPVAGGRDPVSALSQYGMRLAPVPFANEQVQCPAERSMALDVPEKAHKQTGSCRFLCC